MPTNPWGPNEPTSTVHSEEGWLQGALVACIAYGIVLVLYLQCTYLLWKQTKPSTYRSKIPSLIFVFLIFMLCTFFTGADMRATQQAFIANRNYPGGPSAFETDTPSVPLVSVSYALLQWLCDGLLVWRYMMIYNGCAIPTWMIRTPPILAYMASIATGILFLIQLTATSPFLSTNINWTIPYLTISLGLNVILTMAIVARLLLFRRRTSSTLGSTHGSQYTSIAAMLVESASLNSLFNLLLVIPFVLNNPVASVFLLVLGQAQSIATLLIVLRVASGKAWSTDTKETLASIQFSPRSMAQASGSEAISTSHLGTTPADISCMDGPATSSESRSASSIYASGATGLAITKDADENTQSLDTDFAKEAYDKV